MGHSLVRAVQGHKDKVTAVGWTGENTMEEMERMNGPSTYGLLCDVRVRCTVEKVIDQAVKRWGRIDIIVKYANNELWISGIADRSLSSQLHRLRYVIANCHFISLYSVS